MSRSTKGDANPERWSWLPQGANGKRDGIGEEKAGARQVPARKHRSKRQSWIASDRRSAGSTEKTLRRNRQMWARKFSKEGRQLDKQETKDQMS